MSEFDILKNSDTHIHVVDSPMGTGKTTKFIEYINFLPTDKKVIFITPYLKECQRVIDNCHNRKFVQPNVQSGRGRKLSHFLELISDEVNIVSTHSLFSNISDEIIDALKKANYTLILDECFDVVDKFDLFPEVQGHERKDYLTSRDIKVLLDREFIHVAEDYRVIWNTDDYNLTKYEPLRRLAERGLLYLVNDSLLLWSFPVEVFEDGIFEDIFILTFQFESQIQYYYYSYFDLEFDKYHVDDTDGEYTLVQTIDNSHELRWIESVRPLINICDVKKLNAVGAYKRDVRNVIVKTALSLSWYDRTPSLHKRISNNSINWLRNYSGKESSEDVMWTCFIDHQKTISAKGLSMKGFVSLNARATNEYGDRSALLYLINRYINPFFEHFFYKRHINLDQDKYALSELTQWIWRSRIRNGEPINLYIPSQRMRILLEDYLNGEVL